MQVNDLVVWSDSQLVVNQINGSFAAKDKCMAAYLKKVMKLIPCFDKLKLTQIPRVENLHADTL